MRPEIPLPHQQRPTLPAADLDERYRLVREGLEVLFVDREIVFPLMDQPSVVV
jgi:hypothetical protein